MSSRDLIDEVLWFDADFFYEVDGSIRKKHPQTFPQSYTLTTKLFLTWLGKWLRCGSCRFDQLVGYSFRIFRRRKNCVRVYYVLYINVHLQPIFALQDILY